MMSLFRRKKPHNYNQEIVKTEKVTALVIGTVKPCLKHNLKQVNLRGVRKHIFILSVNLYSSRRMYGGMKKNTHLYLFSGYIILKQF